MKHGIQNLSVWMGLCTLLACADNQGVSLAECDMETCSDRCLELAGPDCDILQASCQRRIFDAVSCVRGTPGKVPDVRTVTEQELLEETADAGVDGAEDSGVESDSDGGLGDAEEAARRWDTALRLLQLRLPQTPSDDLEFLGGYYDPSDGRITLIDRGDPQDSPSSQKLLAHELVHGLQDQHMGFRELARKTGRSKDAGLAAGCLTEGEAELYEDLAWSLLRGLSVDQAYWDAQFERRLKSSRQRVIAAESPFDQLWLLRYPVGARFLADAWMSGGDWAVQSLYDSPPNSTVFWMRGFAESQTRTQSLTKILACNIAASPKGFEREGGDTLGAFTLFAFLGHNLTVDGVYQTEKSWSRAKLWRQDHFEVFSGPANEIAVSWRIRFADRKTAHEIAEELRASEVLDVRVKQHDEEIEIFASDSKAVLKAWRGTDPKSCPQEE